MVGWLWTKHPYPLGTKVLFHQRPTTSGTLTLFQGRPGRISSGCYCPPTNFPGNQTWDHWISRLRTIPWAASSPRAYGVQGKLGTWVLTGSKVASVRNWPYSYRKMMTAVEFPMVDLIKSTFQTSRIHHTYLLSAIKPTQLFEMDLSPCPPTALST